MRYAAVDGPNQVISASASPCSSQVTIVAINGGGRSRQNRRYQTCARDSSHVSPRHAVLVKRRDPARVLSDERTACQRALAHRGMAAMVVSSTGNGTVWRALVATTAAARVRASAGRNAA